MIIILIRVIIGRVFYRLLEVYEKNILSKWITKCWHVCVCVCVCVKMHALERAFPDDLLKGKTISMDGPDSNPESITYQIAILDDSES